MRGRSLLLVNLQLVTLLGLLAFGARAQDGGIIPPPPPPGGASSPPPPAPGPEAVEPATTEKPADKPADKPAEVQPPEKPRGPVKPQKGAGEPAPRLTDVDWLIGKPVKQFARGTAYLVFFWAPYDFESLRTLPRLVELQAAHAAERFSVILVAIKDNPDQTPIDGFVERRKSALPFLVARDKLDKTAAAWDALVGLEVPRAVLVDRAGRVAWSGSPLNGMADATAAMLAEDKAKLDDIIATQRELQAAFNEPKTAFGKLDPRIEGNHEKALGLVEAMEAIDPERAARFGTSHYSILLKLARKDEAAALGRKLVAGTLKDSEGGLNELAWFIVNPQGPVKDPDLELASLAANRAYEISLGQDGAILDTLARVRFRQGNKEDAIRLQNLAIQAAWTGAMRAQLQKSLDEYKAPPAKK